MVKRNVEQEILQALDLFVSKDKKLPVTNDGKVNVSGLCKELGLKPSDVQHFHRKESVKLAVNAIAGEQKILPIGARAVSVAEDKVMRERIASVASQSKDLGQAAAEQAAVNTAMAETVRQLKQQGPPLRRLVQIRLSEPDLLCHHEEPVWVDGEIAGTVTSGMYGHRVNASLAMGYISQKEPISANLLASARIEVEIAKERVPATAQLGPWYDPKMTRVKS